VNIKILDYQKLKVYKPQKNEILINILNNQELNKIENENFLSILELKLSDKDFKNLIEEIDVKNKKVKKDIKEIKKIINFLIFNIIYKDINTIVISSEYGSYNSIPIALSIYKIIENYINFSTNQPYTKTLYKIKKIFSSYEIEDKTNLVKKLLNIKEKITYFYEYGYNYKEDKPIILKLDFDSFLNTIFMFNKYYYYLLTGIRLNNLNKERIKKEYIISDKNNNKIGFLIVIKESNEYRLECENQKVYEDLKKILNNELIFEYVIQKNKFLFFKEIAKKQFVYAPEEKKILNKDKFETIKKFIFNNNKYHFANIDFKLFNK